jgi:large subunit ribosomal protein L29
MKKDQLRGLDPAEMQQKLQEISEQTFRIRFQMSMGQPEGLRRLREMRREKARLLTYLRERELDAASKSSGANAPQGVK